VTFGECETKLRVDRKISAICKSFAAKTVIFFSGANCIIDCAIFAEIQQAIVASKHNSFRPKRVKVLLYFYVVTPEVDILAGMSTV